MVHSEFQTIQIAGRDNTGTYPTRSYKLAEEMLHTFLAVEELPTAWRNTKTVFITKARKTTHTTTTDFRPSLTSLLLKSFERMISLLLRSPP